MNIRLFKFSQLFMESDLLFKYKDPDTIKPLLLSITGNLKFTQLTNYFIGDKFPTLCLKHSCQLLRDSTRIKI